MWGAVAKAYPLGDGSPRRSINLSDPILNAGASNVRKLLLELRFLESASETGLLIDVRLVCSDCTTRIWLFGHDHLKSISSSCSLHSQRGQLQCH
jgi:hypothetical protein